MLQAFKAQINPGVRRYNVFWHVFEGGPTLPSTDPNLKCAGGYIKVSRPALPCSLQLQHAVAGVQAVLSLKLTLMRHGCSAGAR